MTLEIFHSDVQCRYNEENQRTEHIENKSSQILLVASMIFSFSQLLDFGFLLIIPMVFMIWLVFQNTKSRNFYSSIKIEKFFKVNNEFCENELEKPLKEAKEQSSVFIEARIKSYLKCIHHNKIINDQKARYLKIIEYGFLGEIVFLFAVILFSTNFSFLLK